MKAPERPPAAASPQGGRGLPPAVLGRRRPAGGRRGRSSMANPAKWERLRPLRPDTLRVSEVHGGRGKEAGERAGRHRDALLPPREVLRRFPKALPLGCPRAGRMWQAQPEWCAEWVPRCVLAGCPGKENVGMLVIVQRDGFLSCVTCSLLIEFSRLWLCLRRTRYSCAFHSSLNACDVRVISYMQLPPLLLVML